jgi:hypothetical protein
MTDVRTPVRRPPATRPPARVFWVRRLIALAVLVLLVVGVYLAGSFLVSAVKGLLGPDEPASQAQDQPSEAASHPAASTGPQPCPAAAVSIGLTADATTYAAGTNPTFTVHLETTGSVPCTLDAGEALRQVVVTSGDDRVWASTDCVAAGAPGRLLLLEPGFPDETPLTWTRVRSAEGCPEGLPAPRPGTYQAVATILGVSTEATVFGLS